MALTARQTSLPIAQQQTAQANVIPAPIEGMDARLNLSIDHPQTCIWAINMVPDEYGVRVRSGYREWQIDVGSEVRTIIPYPGLATPTAATSDRIFAITEVGIYDVTVADDTPVLKFTFATQDANAGWGVWTHYVTQAGIDLVFYADGANGLFTYTPSTDTWAQTTGIAAIAGSANALDITKVVYIVSHKLRLWFITQGATYAWYLPVASIAGDATEFFFGQKFKNGGDLVGLYNWTVDGGIGRDDNLVAVSRAGDVIPWTGEDPADAMTWTSTGVFYIGTVPRGNRIASEYGGELYLLSTLGVTAMSDLLHGANPSDPFRNLIGYKIARLLRIDMNALKDSHGWRMQFNTNAGALMITVPKLTDDTYRQYYYNLSTGGWGLWKDVPMLAADIWEGKIMFGTVDGRVCRMDVGADNVTLDGLSKTSIKWFILTSYLSMGSPAQFKRVKLVRPNFVASEKPGYTIEVYYDYLQSIPLNTTNDPVSLEGGLWDAGLWDQAVWSGTEKLPFSSPRGGSGIGRTIAISIAGASLNDTFLASWDVLWDTGGFL